MRSGTISLDNLKRNGPSVDDYADIILDQAHVLDVHDNYFLLMKPKGAAILYDDFYCIYGDSLCRVRHTPGTSRRLLIDMFERGMRLCRESIRTFTLEREIESELHYLVQEKERNYRFQNAREYAMEKCF